MHHRMNASNETDVQEEVDIACSHQSIGKNPSSDRAIVLKFIDKLVMVGLGVLEEIPGLGPQFFSLKSGEVFWLRANEITRIK